MFLVILKTPGRGLGTVAKVSIRRKATRRADSYALSEKLIPRTVPGEVDAQ